jgi:hypothetical protein
MNIDATLLCMFSCCQFVNLIARKEFGVCGYMSMDSAPSPDLIFEELPDGLSLLGL